MFTEIGQSQTVDGITLTLDGVIRDDSYTMVSMTMDGDIDAENEYEWKHAIDEGICSLMQYHDGEGIKKLYEGYTDEEIQKIRYPRINSEDESGRILHGNVLLWKDDDGGLHLLAGERMKSDVKDMELYMCDMKIGNTAVTGPYSFRFTAENVAKSKTADVQMKVSQGNGRIINIEKIKISPLFAYVKVNTNFDMDIYDTEYVNYMPQIGNVRMNGIDLGYSQSSSVCEADDGSMTLGIGPFDYIVYPKKVDAINMNGSWIEI